MKSNDPRELSIHGYRVALHDFSQAEAFAGLLVKRKWFKPVFGSSSARATEQVALCTAFVVTYARPFSKNRGWSFALSQRDFGAGQWALHQRIVTLRNEIFAHSDAAHHDYEVHESGGIQWGLVTAPSLHLDEITLRAALPLVAQLRSLALDRVFRAHERSARPSA